MKNFKPLLIAALLFSVMSMWGCNQQKAVAVNTKIRELETRYAKLEEDYRTLQAAQEQQQQRLSQSEAQLAALEADKTDLTGKLTAASGERDLLRTQVSQRTQERDTAQNNLQVFSKDLQALAGRVESALNNQSPTPNASSIIPASRRTE